MAEEKIIKIEGMSCGNCKNHVEKALKCVPGVMECVVDLQQNHAKVSMEHNIEDAVLADAVTDAGYIVAAIQHLTGK